MTKPSGTLYIVATPIGNLEDLTRRAERVLRECDLVAAEDTRRARNLLSSIGIDRPVERHDEHTERQKADKLLDALREGRNIALVSDAGVPVVSDPGAHLVAHALAEGLRVVPVPGPSAVLSALAASGFSGDEFAFAGYPPRKQTERREFYGRIGKAEATTVVFEAPHRLRASLADALEVLGPEREVAIAREMTKQFEEIMRVSLADAVQRFTDTEPLGELTLVFGPSSKADTEAPSEDMPEQAVHLLADTDLPTKKAAEVLSAACGVSRKAAYSAVLAKRKVAEE